MGLFRENGVIPVLGGGSNSLKNHGFAHLEPIIRGINA